jgi:heme exporter protein B
VRAVSAIIARDMRLSLRVGGEVLTLVLFFVMIGVTVPFAVGPDRVLLARIAPGIVWIAALLSSLLGLDRIFRADAEDGSLALFTHAAVPLETIVGAKLVAHWLMAALPLLVATPILAILLDMDWPIFWRSELSLLLGTPALVSLGTIGAAVTVSLRRGSLIAPILVLPLSIPILIFGVAALGTGPAAVSAGPAMLFLAAFTLVALVVTPFVAALALRLAEV